MLSSDFPTDVPPYFWTTHGTFSESELRISSSCVFERGVEPLLLAKDMAAYDFPAWAVRDEVN